MVLCVASPYSLRKYDSLRTPSKQSDVLKIATWAKLTFELLPHCFFQLHRALQLDRRPPLVTHRPPFFHSLCSTLVSISGDEISILISEISLIEY
jgi:hypothetical protein